MRTAVNRKQPSIRTLRKIAARKRASTEAHLGMPWGEWEKKKRQQWRAVMHALDAFGFGAAYTPVGNDLYELQQAANRIQVSMDEEWVAW